MLSDIFGELGEDIFDGPTENGDAKEKKLAVEIVDYSAVNHSSLWFLEAFESSKCDDTRELTYYRAAHAYREGDFAKAMQGYEEMLQAGEHRSNHRYVIMDSIIRCGLKMPTIECGLVHLLHDCLMPLVSTYGEQLQFWSLSFEVYKKSGGLAGKCLRAAILLCSSVDVADHWLLLSEAVPQLDGSNLHVGSMCQALFLLRKQSTSSRGFVREACVAKAARLEERLLTRFGAKLVKSAQLAVCTDSRRRCASESDDSLLPPHDCRSKTNLKSDLDQEQMILRFLNAFPWLFVDNQEILLSLLQLPNSSIPSAL